MKKIILIFILIGLSLFGANKSQAIEFVETSEKELSLSKENFSPRAVWFSNGTGDKVVSIGACQTARYRVLSDSGVELVSFMQPCVFGGFSFDNKRAETVSGQLSVGVIEVLRAVSFNVATDTRKLFNVGAVKYGVGINLKFDDSLIGFLGF